MQTHDSLPFMEQPEPLPDAAHFWQMNQHNPSGSVESIELNLGMSLILSNVNASHPFHYTEPQDVFAIGFHLKGGTSFTMPHGQFRTEAMDVWAGVSPRGAASSFIFPREGFKTVSLRFTPESALTLFERHRMTSHPIAKLSQLANEITTSSRLTPLRKRGVELINTMFTSPYHGASRTLHLESCALELLAVQLDANAAESGLACRSTELQHSKKAHVARDWIEAHLNDPPTIAALARIVGTNEFTLKRVFKQVFGTTIFAYVRQRRMELAACELNAGRSVTDAAIAVGYECPRCFAEAFRRHFGVLPSTFGRQQSFVPS